MEGEVARFQSLGGVDEGGVVGGEFAGGGVEFKLIDGVRAGVGNENELVGSVGQDGVGAAVGFELADRALDHRAIFAYAMAADLAAAVVGPEEGLAGAVGGNIGGIGADVCGGGVFKGTVAVVDLEGGDAVAAAHGDVEAVAVGAEALGAGRAGKIDFVFLGQRSVLAIKIVQHEFFVGAGGDADDGFPGVSCAEAGAGSGQCGERGE